MNRITDFTQVIVTVSLTKHRKVDFDRFEDRIRNLNEVVECAATGGGTDYVMKVCTRTLASFQDLMDGLLEDELGIDRYMTYIVTREIKSSHPSITDLAPKIARIPPRDQAD